jgi:hypothetical protein
MEDDDLVLIVLKVLQRLKEVILVLVPVEHIAENYYQRPLVNLLGDLMENLRHVRLALRCFLIGQIFQQRKQFVQVGGSRLYRRECLDAIGEEAQSNGIPLPMQEIAQRGSGVDTESQLRARLDRVAFTSKK